jgi:hypothetical protein
MNFLSRVLFRLPSIGDWYGRRLIRKECDAFQAMANAPMPKGMRALTTDDFLQDGDEYLGGKKWWKIGGPEIQSPVEGDRVPPCIMYYHPRGSINRKIISISYS